jgi:hypothetical protein
MSAEIVALRAEVAALRREVRRRRQRRAWLIPVACLAGLLTLLPTALGAVGFVDLPNPDQGHNANINAIAAAGITKGCNPPVNDAYCPYNTVTRQEMASFIARVGGLGGNPPVANAATVGGFPANALSRANVGVGSGGQFAQTGVYSTLAQVTLTIPTGGVVLVSGSVTVLSAGTANQWAGTVFRLRVVQGGAVSPTQEGIVGTIAGSTGELAVSPVWAFAVTGSGPITFTLDGGQASSFVYGVASVKNPAITALYVPFGPTGVGSSELAPAGDPGPLPEMVPPARP